MRTREKKRIVKLFLEGVSIARIALLAPCKDIVRVEAVLREEMRKRVMP